MFRSIVFCVIEFCVIEFCVTKVSCVIGELKIASGQLLRRIGVGAVMCPVLAGIMATTIARPAAADSRATAYSIHMIAKIPSRCTLRDVSRIVVLEHVVPDDAVLSGGRFDHGRASFRL